VYNQQMTCTVINTFDVDVDHSSLSEANADYTNGEGADYGSDGELRCSDTDRWRDSVLARASVDNDNDEGYHSYRCAISRNQDEGCHNPFHFLQIGEFEDVKEHGIGSECEENGMGSKAFHQHGPYRLRHLGW
jgi:hypothetical protein